MAEPMVSANAFAKAVGVTSASILKAIKNGRVTAYSKAGRQVGLAFAGPKFLKVDEAKEAFQHNRVRLDAGYLDGMAIPPDGARKSSQKSARDLIDAKSEKEKLQSKLLRLRLGREQGELIPKASAIAAVEALGRAVQRAHKAIPGWAEEITGAAHSGGAGAVSGLLLAKSVELGKSIADLIIAEAERGGNEDRGSAPIRPVVERDGAAPLGNFEKRPVSADRG